ncbi:LamG domain-containing protein, partial [Akkermansiaceae bacterium]|nr:LamG domain-containing protein [Akkermansiaceae bacterium]
TFTLTATNPFGTTTKELTVTVLDGNVPDLGWEAAGLPDGNLGQWDPAINATGNNGITFVNNTGGEVQSGTSNFTGVTSWVNSPGYNLSSNPADSWQDGLGDLATKADVSWEMVVRPGDFNGTHTLFNTGGNGDGTAIVLTDSTLDFRFQTANTDEGRIIISTDLAALGSASEFFHIVATADVGSGVVGTSTLYVNGQLIAGPISSTGIIDDWDGGDLAELGKGGNIPAGNPFTFDPFNGDIAVFNYYGGRILNASQVLEKYTAISGGAIGLAITAIDYDLSSGEIRLTFNSVPGRTYALETTLDLTAANWLEIDDSIAAEDTQSIVVINESFLTDPGAARRFFRIRPGVE